MVTVMIRSTTNLPFNHNNLSTTNLCNQHTTEILKTKCNQDPMQNLRNYLMITATLTKPTPILHTEGINLITAIQLTT
jgi:hypothetical protein